jgi:Cdc6-like AAA superfamily ATPase
MTRSERLKAALCALVDERRTEIDALSSVRVMVITLELDDAGLVNSDQVRYDTKRRNRYERQRHTDARSCVA